MENGNYNTTSTHHGWNAETKKRIVIADDDEIVRRLLSVFLTRQNFEVVEATNGFDAVECVKQIMPDAVLLDAVMPVLDGYEACEQIRALPGAGDLPILMISSMDNDTSITKGFDVGVSEYLPKPFHWTLLLRRINTLVNNKHMERQLRYAFRMEGVDTMVGGIAHEFNNILTAILGYTELLGRSPRSLSDEQFRSGLDIIRQASGRGKLLVEQLTIFSRRFLPRKGDFHIHEHIADITEFLRSQLPPNIELQDIVQSNLPTIQMDPVHFKQLLLNMVANARDAIEQAGKIVLAIRQEDIVEKECQSCHQMVSGNYLVICVADNGHGILPEHLNRIFEPFFSTKDVYHGVGMGLSIVHGLIHEYGGHILLASTGSGGTEFMLLLPVDAVKDA